MKSKLLYSFGVSCNFETDRKGTKTRFVPIIEFTADILKSYCQANGINPSSNPKKPLFYNRDYKKLTRSGIFFIPQKYAVECVELIPDTVTPHMLRHSKAMHLLQSGINLVYIRDVLGHTSVKKPRFMHDLIQR